MHIFRDFEELNEKALLKGRSSVITIGNFDGLHRGHFELISQTVKAARAENALAGVITFDPHPVKVLYPERGLKELFQLEQLLPVLEEWGVDFVIVQKFDFFFSKVTASDFIENYLVRYLHPKKIIIGYDFAFGSDRAGSFETLKEGASKFGYDVASVTPITTGEKPISSSRIRQALADGEVESVEELLGRAYFVDGIIREGHARGRQIGFPTANLTTLAEILPRTGVYCTFFEVNERKYPAITNVGFNPTFQEGSGMERLKIETHLLDYDGQLYGARIRLHFLKRVRGEVKFAGIDPLREQIQKDVAFARDYFRQRSK